MGRAPICCAPAHCQHLHPAHAVQVAQRARFWVFKVSEKGEDVHPLIHNVESSILNLGHRRRVNQRPLTLVCPHGASAGR